MQMLHRLLHFWSCSAPRYGLSLHHALPALKVYGLLPVSECPSNMLNMRFNHTSAKLFGGTCINCSPLFLLSLPHLSS